MTPAEAFTRESSLVGIQVLRSSSRRRISANPAVAAACATDSLRATAVIVTNVPICNWARVTTADSGQGYPTQPQQGTAQQRQETRPGVKRLIEQVGMHAFLSSISYTKEVTNYRTGRSLMHSSRR